jgi:hypothetical protein
MGGSTPNDTTVALDASGTTLWQMEGVGIPFALGADGTLYVIGTDYLVALR